MTAGPCEPADTLAIERVVLAPAKHRVVRATVARRGPHAARFSARIGPNATSEAELFRSPCQRISLLVHERFRPVQDRKSTRLNSSHRCISYAVFCLKKK